MWPEIGVPWRNGDAGAKLRGTEFGNMVTEPKKAGCCALVLWNVDIGQFDHRQVDRATSPNMKLVAGQNFDPGAGKAEPSVAAVRAVFTS